MDDNPEATIDDAARARIARTAVYRRPTPAQVARHERLRAAAVRFMETVGECCPASPERRAAFDAIDIALFHANSAIQRNDEQ